MSARFAVGCTALLAALGVVAQEAVPVPISAQAVRTLDGQAGTIELDAATGSILVLGFSRESNPEVREWSRRLRGASPDVRVPIYNVFVLAGAPRLVRGMIRRAIRSSVPEAHRSSFYIVEKNDTFWRALAAANDADAAYVLRLDPTGRACARHVGPVTDGALAKMLETACPSAHAKSLGCGIGGTRTRISPAVNSDVLTRLRLPRTKGALSD